jgi:hypothetical protein
VTRRPVSRFLVAVLAGAGLAATAAVTQTSVEAAVSAPYLDAPMHPLTVGTWGHSAFPGMTRLDNGDLQMVFREGATHTSLDGRIILAESHNDGLTWGNPQVIREGGDWRDPVLSNPDGALRLTWFRASASNPALGAELVKIWGWDRRIDDGSLAKAAISAPIVQLPDGRLATAFYGQKPGESRYTAWWAWSADGGWTWTSNRIANLLGANLDASEPYLVVNGNLLHIVFRWGTADGIGMRTSMDMGKTWDTQRKILNQASGRPTTIATSTGMLLMVYRQLPSQSAAMAYSVDNGATWVSGGVVLAAPTGSPNGMTYATMVTSQDDPQKIRIVCGMEQADGSSDLWGGTVVLP